MIEPDGRETKVDFLIQSHNETGAMYLWKTTSIHKQFFDINLQPAFPTNDFANRVEFLSSHPPKYLGLAI